jgi:hypothetical protein
VFYLANTHKWYESATAEERDVKIRSAEKTWTGVQGSMETIEWLWNHHFAAVAGDSISWEVRSPSVKGFGPCN